MVRANYRNVAKGIEYTSVYLERFFRNLLLGVEVFRLDAACVGYADGWGVQAYVVALAIGKDLLILFSSL